MNAHNACLDPSLDANVRVTDAPRPQPADGDHLVRGVVLFCCRSQSFRAGFYAATLPCTWEASSASRFFALPFAPF